MTITQRLDELKRDAVNVASLNAQVGRYGEAVLVAHDQSHHPECRKAARLLRELCTYDAAVFRIEPKQSFEDRNNG